MRGPEPAIPDGRRRALDPADVPEPAALRHEPATRSGHRGEVSEQRVVVGHPVERRRRQDGVDLPVDRQWLPEVRDDVLDPIAEPGESIARLVDHRA